MDKKSKSKIFKLLAFIILLVVIVLVVGVVTKPKVEENKYPNLDIFAQCISDSGAKFYGAFWCSHCGEQKQIFGSAKQYLPYVECSSADGRSQLEICNKEGIKGFPTWKFADGSELSGRQELETLAAKTSCNLPEIDK